MRRARPSASASTRGPGRERGQPSGRAGAAGGHGEGPRPAAGWPAQICLLSSQVSRSSTARASSPGWVDQRRGAGACAATSSRVADRIRRSRLHGRDVSSGRQQVRGPLQPAERRRPLRRRRAACAGPLPPPSAAAARGRGSRPQRRGRTRPRWCGPGTGPRSTSATSCTRVSAIGSRPDSTRQRPVRAHPVACRSARHRVVRPPLRTVQHGGVLPEVVGGLGHHRPGPARPAGSRDESPWRTTRAARPLPARQGEPLHQRGQPQQARPTPRSAGWRRPAPARTRPGTTSSPLPAPGNARGEGPTSTGALLTGPPGRRCRATRPRARRQVACPRPPAAAPPTGWPAPRRPPDPRPRRAAKPTRAAASSSSPQSRPARGARLGARAGRGRPCAARSSRCASASSASGHDGEHHVAHHCPSFWRPHDRQP